MNIRPLLFIIIFWAIVKAVSDYLKKRGSKLGEEKPIYKYIAWGIYGTLAVGAIILIILFLLQEK